RILAAKVLLKWANTIRNDVANGLNSFWTLDHAERAELRAVQWLESEVLNRRVATARKAKVRTLVDQIPSRELRSESRKRGLLADWKEYVTTPWRQERGGDVYYSKFFLFQPVAYTVSELPFERTRADRYIDELTQLLLDQLERGLPANAASPGYAKRESLWDQAMVPPDYRFDQSMPVCQNWTEDYETRIRKLRKAVSLP
ncbi:MAG: hypothetical protein ACR2NZ_26025, partial [Rubripirellula sp.]